MIRLLAILILLSMINADPRARWIDSTHAVVEWSQSSQADRVCVDRQPATGGPVLIGCFAGVAGWHTIVVPQTAASIDGAYRPRPGDRYIVSEYQNGAWLRNLQPAPLGWWVWLPGFMARP